MNEWMNHNEIIKTHLENVMPTLSSLCLLNVTSLGTMLGTGNTAVTEYLTSSWIFSPDLLRTVLRTLIMWYAELYHVCLPLWPALDCISQTHMKKEIWTHTHIGYTSYTDPSWQLLWDRLDHLIEGLYKRWSMTRSIESQAPEGLLMK